MNPSELLDEIQLTPKLSKQEKLKKITYHFTEILKTLELDLNDPSLSETPSRIAKMYLEEMFSGLDPKNFPPLTYYACDDIAKGEMIIINDISIESTCEHHFVPIIGKATIAYFPGNKIIGLSKINRIARFFSKQPQLQERLTHQIATCLRSVLETPDIAVWIKAKHFCVRTRGAHDNCSETITHSFLGKFKKDSSVRSEFFSLLKK